MEFDRDALGRVTAEAVNGRRIESTYDCCGHRVSRRLGGTVVESTYDPLGALTGLSLGGRAPLGLSYDAAGRKAHCGGDLGFTLESRHDPVGQLIRQVAGRGAVPGAQPAVALERAYAWNGAFEPVAIADARWGRTAYRYDANGQVTEARHGDGLAERFDYDPALNVAAFQEVDAGPGGPVQAASLAEAAPDTRLRFWQGSAGGRVAQAWGPQGERVGYVHDALGRVVERRVERAGFRPKVWRYGWDGRDRLVTCETPEGTRWSYAYDPFGRRLWKRRADADGTVVGTAYGWDGDLLSAEAPLGADGAPDWDRAIVWHYEPGTFRPLAREGSDGSLLYVVTDHLGTPRELLDETGRAVWAAEYRLWGAVRRVWVAANDDGSWGRGSGGAGGRRYAVAGNLALASEASEASEVEAVLLCPIRFQGQWQDQETGLVYNRFRYYDALTTQYVSPDPMGIIAGVRSNAYVARPTVLVDVYGLIAWAPLGSGICIVQKFTAGSAEADELAQFVGEWNKEIIGRGGRMTGGSLTELQRNVQERWRKEFRQKNCCEPGQVAGHLPDAAAGGMPNPSLEKGLVQSGTTNRYLGGITGDLARRGQSYTHVYLRDSCG